MTTTALRTLFRLDWLRFTHFWSRALRDPVFDIAVIAGLAIAFSALRRLWQAAAGASLWQVFAAGVAVGGLLAWQAFAGPGSRPRAMLESGPFHSLIAEPRAMTRWMLLRAVVIAAAVLVPSDLVLAVFDLRFGAVIACATALGVALFAAAAWLIPARQANPASERARERPKAPTRPWPAPITVARSSLRRGWAYGGLAPGVVLILGAVIGALAAHNNSSPAMGGAAATIAALIAAILLLPGGRLPSLLGREPVSFLTLFLWLYAAPLAVALVGGALAGAVAAGPMQGLQAGVTGATGIFVLGWMHFLHRMIRSERNTALSTGLDFLNALLLSAVEVSLAPFYIALRGLILVRAASRRRWLDR